MFLFETHALFLVLLQFLWLESQVWKEFRFENRKSDIVRIQDPRCSKNFSWIQGRNLGSGSKIQDFEKLVGKPWIQQSHLDPRFLLWIQEKFFEHIGSWILDSCALGSEVWQLFRLDIPSLTAVQTWNPKSDSCPDLKSQVWGPTGIFQSNVIYVYVYVHVFVSLCICVCVPIKSFPGRSQGRGTGGVPHIFMYIYIYMCMHIYIYIYHNPNI